MNKYESLALESRKERIKDRSCSRKKKYSSREEALAFQKNQSAYLCKFCGNWHLSGSLIQQIRVSKPVASSIKRIEREFHE